MFSVAQAVAWVRATAAVVEEHAAELTRLDSAIGDGDHGTNMNRGFKAAVQRLDGLEGEQVLLFVNSMGGTPLAELYVVYRRVVQLLDEGGVQVARHLVGPFITSLEMQGASVTILRLDDEKTRLWDAPVLTPGLRWGV